MSNTLDLDLLALLKLARGDSREGTVAGPNPTALPSLVSEEDVGEQRSLFCTEYDDCLDLAIRQRWSSWTCMRCTLSTLAKDLRATLVDHGAALRPDA
jgi:hypothetical protein